MNDSVMHFVFLLAITIVSLTMVIAQDNNNSILNNTSMNNKIAANTIQNNTNLSNASLNLTALNNSILNDTNNTSFMIRSDVKSNESVFEIRKPTKPIQNASKLGYIIQATPHGYV
ncbi:MAG: hypothetical protein MUO26_06495 [Methanotrichaceae archaeon]|nr:hypothetical protein [Methanotrichaceae archaeon]